MTTDENRLTNLQTLIREFGSIVAVAKRAETAPNYISQIINRTVSRTGKPRGVGNDLARKLEAGCNKPHGWMDQEHQSTLTTEDQTFVHRVEQEVANYDVPEHIRQTIMTLITRSPKRVNE